MLYTETSENICYYNSKLFSWYLGRDVLYVLIIVVIVRHTLHYITHDQTKNSSFFLFQRKEKYFLCLQAEL